MSTDQPVAFGILMVICGAAMLCCLAGMAYSLWAGRDRRHQRCRWWSAWRHRPCYACIAQFERECGIKP